VGEIELHVVSRGEGPPVVFLHGFPEFWYSWRHQIEALSAAGFQAIAPDLRGYNLSDKPTGVGAYRTKHLVGDVAGLIRAMGHEKAHVVSHDWGGAVAWHFAEAYPEMVEKLVVLNCPHPALMARRIWIPPQLFRSWYMFFFQLPSLPESRITKPAFVKQAFRGWATNPDAFSDEDLARYHEAICQPGAATAAINYYRAAMRRPTFRWKTIDAPTMVIWGDQDKALGTELLRGTERIAPNLRVEHIPDASHWVQHDRPERVNELLLTFLKSDP
jgi:pimeloyl-ACP methyl ester carboxylesterase